MLLKKAKGTLVFLIYSYLQSIHHGPNREERWAAPEIFCLQEAIEGESCIDV